MENVIKELDHKDLTRFYISLVVMATIGGFLYGYDQSDIGSVLIFIPYYSGASAFVVGYMASGALLGAAIGAIVAAFLTDRFGRKAFLIADIAVYIIGLILSIATTDVLMLMIARTVVGFAIGADSAIATAYISEFAPEKHRGALGGHQQYMIIIGIFMSYLVAMVIFLLIPGFAYSIDWRAILGLAIIPAIIALIYRAKMPESPRWLILNKKFEKAKKTLKYFEINANDSDLNYTYNVLSDEIKNSRKLDKGAMRALLISGLFMFFMIANGVNVPMIYGPYIISKLHIFPSGVGAIMNDVYSIAATVILVLIMLIATYVGMKKVDSVGRRKLALIGFAGMAISDFVGGALYLMHIDIALLIGLAGYLVFFGIGGGIIGWLIQGEYFPTVKRGFFAAFGALSEWITSFAIDEIFPYMDGTIHLGYSVIIFSVISVVAFITLYYIMPETNGMTLEEVSRMFMSSNLLDLRKYNNKDVIKYDNKDKDNNI